MEKQTNRKFSNVLAALCFAMSLALLLSAVGTTLAKYIRTDKGNGAAVAAPFYFTSDKLSADSPYYQVSESPEDGSVEITFELSNFIDELRCTDETISYEYWVVRGADDTGEVIATTENTGTLSGKFKSESVSIKMKQEVFGDDGIVTAFVKTTAPYEKIISARFGFAAQYFGMQWRVVEQENAVVVNLAWGEGGTVTVAWPASLVPDRTDAILSTAGDSAVTFDVNPGVSYALTFLKTNSAESFTKDSFKVTVS